MHLVSPVTGMVQQQPMQGGRRPVQWMARPAGIPGCPPGLEYLTQIDQLLVHQQVEMMECKCSLTPATLTLTFDLTVLIIALCVSR